MNAAAKAGLRTIRLANGIVDTIVLIIILLLVVVGCFAIWDSNQVLQAAVASQYEIYKPAEEDNGLSFRELQSINPEVFAWLTVYGTHIDYPVVQGMNNMKYVNTNALGQYSLSGAIFLDTSCSIDFSDFSSILYGHHMDKQAMFGEIGLFAQKDYFDARRYGMLYNDEKEHGLEFFAFVHCDAYDTSVFRTSIEEPEEQQEYLDLLFETATLTRDVSVTIADHIVLLSTCSSSATNGRDILVGRITDEVYDDPFWTEEADRETPVVQGLLSVWTQILPWIKLAVILLVISLLLMLLVIIHKKGRRNR